MILYNLVLSFERLAFILKDWCLPRVKGAVLLASGIIGKKGVEVLLGFAII